MSYDTGGPRYLTPLSVLGSLSPRFMGGQQPRIAGSLGAVPAGQGAFSLGSGERLPAVHPEPRWGSPAGVRSGIGVVLVGGAQAYRSALEQVLNGTAGFECLGNWADAAEASRRVGGRAVEVALVDVEPPDCCGLEFIRNVKGRPSAPCVIAQSSGVDRDRVAEVFLAGADGYLLRGPSPVVVLDGIRSVIQGGWPVSPRVVGLLVHLLRGEDQAPGGSCGLTGRERELLRLLGTGEALKGVADRMGVRLETARTHARALYRKLGVHSRSEAVARYLRFGRGSGTADPTVATESSGSIPLPPTTPAVAA